ncbi:protein phosphatase 2C domain-containing protein [Anaerolineales bacterium HSG24]|nr:protein phosphatase 2C domain-containing protein [Anaerolineales bacterium HSG24]
MVNVTSASKTDVGRKRDHNEDFVWSSDELGIYIVADGLGGYDAGEVASQMATKIASEAIKKHLVQHPPQTSPEQLQQLLIDTLETTNKKIYNAAQQDGQHQKMGTTIVLALLQLPTVYISHAGDSRAYLIREGQMRQLTEDDVWMATGNLRNVLTKAIGQEHALEPSFYNYTLNSGDWLLLCSDGLWNMLPDEQILAVFEQNNQSPTTLTDALIKAANNAGGLDNITVTTLKIV